MPKSKKRAGRKANRDKPLEEGTSSRSDKRPENTSSSSSASPILSADSGNGRTSDLRDKLILVVIEIVILGSLSFLAVQKYSTLKNFSDVRFEVKSDVARDAQGTDELRLRYLIYRLGEQPISNLELNFGIPEEEREIYGIKTASVNEYETSFLNMLRGPSKYEAKGKQTAPEEDDPDYNKANSYRFTFDQLSPDYTYECVVVLHRKNVTSNDVTVDKTPGFFFSLIGTGHQTYDHRMQREDFIRIYLTELLIVTVLVLLVLGLLIWMVGSRLLTH